MTLCSTVASFFTNFTLILDLIRTADFSKSGSGLTRRQRSLVVVVIILISYIAFGALVNSFLLHLSFVNALYFTVVTIETIGFGDIHPDSTASAVFICFYASFGILNLGLAVAMTRETVLEALQVSYRNRLKAVRARRKAARRRTRVEHRWREALQWRLREVGVPIWVKDKDHHHHTTAPDANPNIIIHTISNTIATLLTEIKYLFREILDVVLRILPGYTPKHAVYGYGYHPHGKHLNMEALNRAQLEAAALEAGAPLKTLLPPLFRGCDITVTAGGDIVYLDDERNQRDEEEGGVGEAILDGIAGLWRGRSRDERDAESQAIPLTHVSLGRMIAMVGRFALAQHRPTHMSMPMHAGEISPPLSSPLSPVVEEREKEKENEKEEDEDEVTPRIIDLTDPLPRSPVHSPSRSPPRLHSPNRSRSPVPILNNASEVDVDFTLTYPHESDKIGIAQEERKAFYAQVTVACTLFIVFWTVGGGIYTTTEGWTYGQAMYFCFISFTTIGYGDLSPTTAAGRSVFVVWALLGVGTLTILVSGAFFSSPSLPFFHIPP
jgi:potassium channel subfamily K, other eukaryote